MCKLKIIYYSLNLIFFENRISKIPLMQTLNMCILYTIHIFCVCQILAISIYLFILSHNFSSSLPSPNSRLSLKAVS